MNTYFCHLCWHIYICIYSISMFHRFLPVFSPSSCIDEWFEVNRSCPEHPSDWSISPHRFAPPVFPSPFFVFLSFYLTLLSFQPAAAADRDVEPGGEGGQRNAGRWPLWSSKPSHHPHLHLPNNVVPQCAKSHSDNLQGFFSFFFFLSPSLSSSCLTCTSHTDWSRPLAGSECAGRPLDSERQLIAHHAEEEGERGVGGRRDGGIISPPSALSVFLKVELFVYNRQWLGSFWKWKIPSSGSTIRTVPDFE